MHKNDEQKIKQRVKDQLMHWFGLAGVRHIAAGRMWYNNAHVFAKQLSKSYQIPFPTVVGVIAALSPSVHWSANQRQAEALCRAHADGGPLESIIVTTYGRQAAKARKILFFDPFFPEKSLGKRAFKTKAFYSNIYRPEATDRVTIDQHMIAAAGFTEFWVSGAAWCYDLLADVVREIAEEQNLCPCQVQAIIWLTYKDLTDSKHPAERVEDKEDEELPI